MPPGGLVLRNVKILQTAPVPIASFVFELPDPVWALVLEGHGWELETDGASGNQDPLGTLRICDDGVHLDIPGLDLLTIDIASGFAPDGWWSAVATQSDHCFVRGVPQGTITDAAPLASALTAAKEAGNIIGAWLPVSSTPPSRVR